MFDLFKAYSIPKKMILLLSLFLKKKKYCVFQKFSKQSKEKESKIQILTLAQFHRAAKLPSVTCSDC